MAAGSASVHGSVSLTATWDGPFKMRDLTIQAVQLVFSKSSQYVSVNVIPVGFRDDNPFCQFRCILRRDGHSVKMEQVAQLSTSVEELNKLGIRIILGSRNPEDLIQESQLTVEQPEQGVLPNSHYNLVISNQQDVSAKLVLESCLGTPSDVQATPQNEIDMLQIARPRRPPPTLAVLPVVQADDEKAKQTISMALEVIALCVEEIAPTHSSWVCQQIKSKHLHALMQEVIQLGASKNIHIPVLFAQWLTTTSNRIFQVLQYDVDTIKVPDGESSAQTLETGFSVGCLQVLCRRFFSLIEKKHIVPHDMEKITLNAHSLLSGLKEEVVSWLQALLKTSDIECRDIQSLEKEVQIATQASIKSLLILIETVFILMNLADGRYTIKNNDVGPLEIFFDRLRKDGLAHESLMEIIQTRTSAEETKKSLDLVQKKYQTILEVILACIEGIAPAYGAQAASAIKALGVKAIEAFMQNLGETEVKPFLEPILSPWLVMTSQNVFEDLPGTDFNKINPNACLDKLMNPEVVATIERVLKQLAELVKQPLIDSIDIQRFQKKLVPLSTVLKHILISFCEEYVPKSKEGEFAIRLSIVAEQKSKAFMQHLQIITSMSLALLSLSKQRPVQTLFARHMKPLEALWN